MTDIETENGPAVTRNNGGENGRMLAPKLCLTSSTEEIGRLALARRICLKSTSQDSESPMPATESLPCFGRSQDNGLFDAEMAASLSLSDCLMLRQGEDYGAEENLSVSDDQGGNYLCLSDSEGDAGLGFEARSCQDDLGGDGDPDAEIIPCIKLDRNSKVDESGTTLMPRRCEPKEEETKSEDENQEQQQQQQPDIRSQRPQARPALQSDRIFFRLSDVSSSGILSDRACLGSGSPGGPTGQLVLSPRRCLRISGGGLQVGGAETELLPCLEDGSFVPYQCLVNEVAAESVTVPLPKEEEDAVPLLTAVPTSATACLVSPSDQDAPALALNSLQCAVKSREILDGATFLPCIIEDLAGREALELDEGGVALALVQCYQQEDEVDYGEAEGRNQDQEDDFEDVLCLDNSASSSSSPLSVRRERCFRAGVPNASAGNPPTRFLTCLGGEVGDMGSLDVEELVTNPLQVGTLFYLCIPC